MGACPIPLSVPRERLGSLTTKSIDTGHGVERIEFAYLKDTDEWVAEDKEDRDFILEHVPGAKFFKP